MPAMVAGLPQTDLDDTAPRANAASCPVGVCAHCRAPLPRAAVADADARLYCCTGCRSARALLASTGLEHYYALARGTGQPGDAATADLPWLDATLAAALARPGARPERAVLDLDVQGLHCAACVWVLQALFRRHPGAHHLLIDPGAGRLRLTLDSAQFPLADYLTAIARLGYRTGPPSRDPVAPSDGLGLRLGVTVAIAMNAMALSLGGYFGLEPGDPEGLFAIFGWGNFLLATAAMLVASPIFVRGAFQALRHRTLHLDVPIALGVLLAYGGSVLLFFTGHPEHAYFDTLDIFLALMLLGRWVQRRTLDRNRRLVLADDGLALARMKVVAADGTLHHTPLGEVASGMRLLIAPGELIPVTADLADAATLGPAAANLAWINGESDPVTFAGDHPLPAGAHLVSSTARLFIARERFSGSALARLLEAPAADSTPHAPADAFWHRLTTVWVLTVLAFAALTAWAWHATPLLALHYATAVLVVTCPCAIGLATPLAYELAALRLRRRGLISRRPNLLDRARSLRHVVFDKTGTLTWATPALSEPDLLLALPEPAQAALWQLTARSNHPKSRAISAFLADHLPADQRRLDPALRVTETPGVGLATAAFSLTGDGRVLSFSALAASGSPVPLAHIPFDEQLRDGAAAEVARLHALGVTVHIASGDAPDKVSAMARALGLPEARAHARLCPEGKAALVTRLGASTTLVLGDGVNDVLAFEAAGMAGTPALDRAVLPARADFVLTTQGVGPIAELIALGRRTRTLMRRNLAIALVYNVAGLTAGLAGALTPVIAAVAMPASSLLVLGLTLFAARPSRDPVAPHLAAPLPPKPPRSATWMPST